MNAGPTISQSTAGRIVRNKKYRTKQGWFAAEGDRWIHELLRKPKQIVTIFATRSWIDSSEDARSVGVASPLKIISDQEMRQLADTTTPSGILAVARQPKHQLPSSPSLLLALDGLRDPGNVGTLIRSAAASGADAVVCLPKTVDIYNPKAVRASMAALLRIPIVSMDYDKLGNLSERMQLYGAEANEPTTYTQVDWTVPSGLLIGNEAHGLSEHGKKLCTALVSIPMGGETESLNAAVAGSVMLFEAARQRA